MGALHDSAELQVGRCWKSKEGWLAWSTFSVGPEQCCLLAGDKILCLLAAE